MWKKTWYLLYIWSSKKNGSTIEGEQRWGSCGNQLPRFLTEFTALDSKEHSFLLKKLTDLVLTLDLVTNPSGSLLTPFSLASSRPPSSSSPWVLKLLSWPSVLLAPSSLSSELSRAQHCKGRPHKARHSKGDKMHQRTWVSKENFAARLKCRPSLLRSVSHINSQAREKTAVEILPKHCFYSFSPPCQGLPIPFCLEYSSSTGTFLCTLPHINHLSPKLL